MRSQLGRRRRLIVQLDHFAAGQQIVAGDGGGQTFAQSGLELLFPVFFALFVGIDFHARRLDADAHGNPAVFKQMQAVVAVEIGNVGNHAHIQPFIFDGRTCGQTAHGLFEKRGVVQRTVIGQVRNFAAAVVKRETVFALHIFAVFGFRRIKRDRAGKQRGQRSGIEFHAAACGFDIDAALQPEAAFRINQFVVRTLDEDGVMHGLVGRLEMRTFYLSDHKVFIKHRAADVEDFVVLTDQLQAQAALSDGGNRRDVLYFKYVLRFIAFAGRKRDIRAGQERAQTGYAALVDTRFHHPKLRIAADEVFRISIELGSDFHAFLVVAQLDAGNVSDIDVQYFNHRVVDFNAFRTVHQKRDDRTSVADVFHQQPAACNQRNQRNQPHDRREDIGFFDTRGCAMRLRRIVFFHCFWLSSESGSSESCCCLSQIRRGSK